MNARDKERLIALQKMLRIARVTLRQIADGDARDPQTLAWEICAKLDEIETKELRA